MTAAAAALLAQFEQDAKAAQVAEAALRKSLGEQIARLEKRRAHAFRRTRLVRALAEAVPEATTPETAVEAWPRQSQAVCDELGWTALSESYRTILGHLAAVGAAVAQRLSGPAGTADVTADVTGALETFEAWFEATHGKPFYVLFDQYVPEVPVVDF